MRIQLALYTELCKDGAWAPGYQQLTVDDDDPITWSPLPMQLAAIINPAFDLGYGGAAGGGKTDLIAGLALLCHRRSLIVRREYPQLKGIIDRLKEILDGKGQFNGQDKVFSQLPPRRLTYQGMSGAAIEDTLERPRVIELGSVPHPGDEERYQGRPHDFRAFDELPHLLQQQFRFLCGWVRTTDEAQRCRVVATFNPPTTAEGMWVKQHYGPWLDPAHPRRANPGEVLWIAMVDGEEHIMPNGEPFEHNGDVILPTSRSFLPARLADNPFLDSSGYRAIIMSLPEPLRSQLLTGDFSAEPGDEMYQVIPSSWLKMAVQRWRERYPDGWEVREGDRLRSIGVDVARGGAAKTVLAKLYESMAIAPLKKIPGRLTPDGPSVATVVLPEIAGDAYVTIDLTGVGTSPYDCLKGVSTTQPFNGSSKSFEMDRAKRLRFVNKRAEAWWRLREELDPGYSPTLALPDDPEMFADLTAPRWELNARGIQVEDKEEIMKRLGRSPDCEAIIYALAPWEKIRRGRTHTGGSVVYQ